MAQQRNITIHTRRAVAGALLAGAIAGAPGCAVDPVFANRFDHCMTFWQAQESGPQMTVYPEGLDKVGFCSDWSRQGVGVGVLTATVHQSATEKES